jgi:hypothetical protein
MFSVLNVKNSYFKQLEGTTAMASFSALLYRIKRVLIQTPYGLRTLPLHDSLTFNFYYERKKKYFKM